MLKKLDFVVVDLLHNPTIMALTDMMGAARHHQQAGAGECKSDWEINFELAWAVSNATVQRITK